MSSSNNSFSIGFSGILTILFIALKLTNVIAWSWLWVLSPLWISAITVTIGILGLVALAVWAKS